MFRFHILKCSEFSVRKCENVERDNVSLQSQKVIGDSDKRLIFPEVR